MKPKSFWANVRSISQAVGYSMEEVFLRVIPHVTAVLLALLLLYWFFSDGPGVDWQTWTPLNLWLNFWRSLLTFIVSAIVSVHVSTLMDFTIQWVLIETLKNPISSKIRKIMDIISLGSMMMFGIGVFLLSHCAVETLYTSNLSAHAEGQIQCFIVDVVGFLGTLENGFSLESLGYFGAYSVGFLAFGYWYLYQQSRHRSREVDQFSSIHKKKSKSVGRL
ncbi:MAG: hypothetical protein OXC96_10610 [Cyanobacteria bacterium MAG CAR1_bin_15]|nr:hypothetical protein [Cyanobacteria bacterium MAG CAR1_bin_15]